MLDGEVLLRCVSNQHLYAESQANAKLGDTSITYHAQIAHRLDEDGSSQSHFREQLTVPRPLYSLYCA